MSAKSMGQVWDLDLPYNKMLVLLAMTDHADHNGNSIFPSIGLIAWKIGYSERQVQRIIHELVADGLLVLVDERVGTTNLYRFEPSAGKPKEPYKPPKKDLRQFDTPDNMSPGGVTKDVRGGGDITVSPKPSSKPSVVNDDAAKPRQVVITWAEQQRKKDRLVVANTKTTGVGMNVEGNTDKRLGSDMQAGDVALVVLGLAKSGDKQATSMSEAQYQVLHSPLLTREGDSMPSPQYFYETYPKHYREYLETRVIEQMGWAKMNSRAVGSFLKVISSPSWKGGWLDVMRDKGLELGLPKMKHEKQSVMPSITEDEPINQEGFYDVESD